MDLDPRRRLRSAENRASRMLRDDRAESVATQAPVPWDVVALSATDCCLLISYRRDGRAAPTPMWFAPLGDDIVLRSGARDAKLARIRANPLVLVAGCDYRGAPSTAPMRGSARIISGADADAAERALADRLGRRRGLYNVTRARLLDMAYVEVRPD